MLACKLIQENSSARVEADIGDGEPLVAGEPTAEFKEAPSRSESGEETQFSRVKGT